MHRTEYFTQGVGTVLPEAGQLAPGPRGVIHAHIIIPQAPSSQCLHLKPQNEEAIRLNPKCGTSLRKLALALQKVKVTNKRWKDRSLFEKTSAIRKL